MKITGTLADYIGIMERNEEWTQAEKRQLPKRDKKFIRTIQFVHSTDKKSAMDIFKSYKKSGLSSKRRFRNQMEQVIRNNTDMPHVKVKLIDESKTTRRQTKAPQLKKSIEEKKIERKFVHLRLGEWLPLGGSAQKFQSIKTGNVISRRAFYKLYEENKKKEKSNS